MMMNWDKISAFIITADISWFVNGTQINEFKKSQSLNIISTHNPKKLKIKVLTFLFLYRCEIQRETAELTQRDFDKSYPFSDAPTL